MHKKKDQRKKHVESMFVTNKKKNYPYYYKRINTWLGFENQNGKSEYKRKYYSLKIVQSGYITIKPLKSLVRIFKWFVKTKSIKEGKLKLKLNIFPDFVLTAKSKAMRMGKGKGAEKEKVGFIKADTILFSIKNTGVSYFLAKKLITRMSAHVPLKHT
jgi:ribosomal protein L16/L10AE